MILITMKCSNCGFENPEGFAYCGKCGNRLAPPPSPMSATDQQASIQQLKQSGDAALDAGDKHGALHNYSEALALLDAELMASDASLHLYYLKLRFDLLAARVKLWDTNGQYEHIEPDMQEMLSVSRRVGDGTRLASAIDTLAHFRLAQRQYDQARPLLEELASLHRSLNDRDGEASALAELAFLSWRQGRFESVADALQRAHELRRHLADPAGLAQSYFDLGLLYRDGLSQAFYAANHFEKAIELAHQSVAQLEQQGLIDLGISWLRMGDKARARMTLDQAQRLIEAHGLPEQKATLLMAQALLQHAHGSDEASRTAARAVAQASELTQPDVEWTALWTRARIEQEREDWDSAQLLIDRMRGLEQNHALYAYCPIWSNALQARNHIYTGHQRAAVDAATYAIHSLQSHGQPGVPLPQMILWIQFEVLNHTNDQSTLHFLRQARETMLAQANTIADSALRASFLRDVAINRSIGDQWARMHK